MLLVRQVMQLKWSIFIRRAWRTHLEGQKPSSLENISSTNESAGRRTYKYDWAAEGHAGVAGGAKVRRPRCAFPALAGMVMLCSDGHCLRKG